MLRILLQDPYSDLIRSVLKGLETFISRSTSFIHMVSETLIYILQPLLTHRHHMIRFQVITVRHPTVLLF